MLLIAAIWRNFTGKIHFTPCRVGANFILRFAVCSKFTESEDIQFAYDEISEVANELLSTTVWKYFLIHSDRL